MNHNTFTPREFTFVKQMWLVAICVLLVGLPAVSGQISEDFDSYAVGDIGGQGAWVDFGGTLTANVTDALAHSGTQSLEVSINPAVPNPIGVPGYGSDVFLDLPADITSGQWNLSYWLHVPANFNGIGFGFFSEGSIGANVFDYGMELIVDGDPTSDIFVYTDGVQSFGRQLVRDTWVEVSALIDLDNNTLDVSYAGDSLFSGAWDPDPFVGDAPTLRGFNLWAQDGVGGSIYYDDINLAPVPEPASWFLLLIALTGIQYFRRS